MNKFLETKKPRTKNRKNSIRKNQTKTNNQQIIVFISIIIINIPENYIIVL